LDPSRSDVLFAFVEGARRFARGRGGLMVKVDPPWEDSRSAEALSQAGFRPVGGEGGFGGVQPRCVMQLDLQRPLDEILASFHHKWRYNIRLAGKKGVVIRKSDDPNDLDTFFRLYEVTARRDGFRGRPRGYFTHMREALGDRLHLFVGEFDGEPLCAALCFHLGDRVWYVYGASADVHRERMPNYLMQWEMISWAHSLGCRWYDFRGVSCTPDDPNDKTAGLNRFKRGFSPRFVRYIGEFDLPLHGPAYWAFTRALPKLQALMKRSRPAATAGD
jgi:lipid II:glycine glycyltransferase (peptidoglycan interpeptide bridge formation enzyme)